MRVSNKRIHTYTFHEIMPTVGTDIAGPPGVDRPNITAYYIDACVRRRLSVTLTLRSPRFPHARDTDNNIIMDTVAKYHTTRTHVHVYNNIIRSSNSGRVENLQYYFFHTPK